MKKGKIYEDIACKYLESIGYKVIHRNYHCAFGEIDIIALDGERLVFIEVKGSSISNPAERINKKKVDRLKLCMEKFLSQHFYEEIAFEVIVITKNSVEHIRDIFLDF